MQKISYIFKILVTTCFVLLSGCDDRAKHFLCPNEIIDELASTRFAKEHGTTELWKILKDQGHFEEAEYDTSRAKFVNMQFLFESAIASMLKNKQIIKASAVIYTPKPSTPLRANGKNFNQILTPQILQNPDELNTVVSRYESLREYLQHGGTIYSMYKNVRGEEEIPGMDVYHEELKQYPENLFDVPMDNFDSSHTGASYLVMCNNGEIIFFSISAAQIGQDTRQKSWKIYYGSLSNYKIKTHYKALKNLYKKSGVSFNLDSWKTDL